MDTKAIRRILFVAFAFTVPVLWFALFAAGFFPLIVILLCLLCFLGAGDIFGFVVCGINLAFWGTLLFFIAGLCARAIERAPQSWRPPIVAVVLGVLSVLPFLSIYDPGDAGGGHSGPVNLYQLFYQMFLKSHFLM